MANGFSLEHQDVGRPTLGELTRVFARIGCLSFGGPAGQIALMHHEMVDERRWISEEQYLHALNFCHLLPGPEAQQLATWIGWKLHGRAGGLIAGMLFVLPGALVILALSILYGAAAGLEWFAALFLGIKAAVLAIVVQAVLRVASRALGTRFKAGLAVAAFLALFVFNLPFPLVVLGAGAIGMAVAASGEARAREWLGLKPMDADAVVPPRPALWMTLRTVLTGAALWAAPMLLIVLTLGQAHVLWQIGSFFSQLAVVTFGGAYAVLAYMAQEAVQGFGWLAPGEMADGLGLAESTPGPLIMVTQFVGYLAATRDAAPFSPVMAGVLGAALTTWVTFVPCFLWIFTFAPWIERLEHAQRLKAGLSALTAAIVGVIANLSVWFALHLLFGRVTAHDVGPVRLQWPDVTTLDWRAAVLVLVAAVLLFRVRLSVLWLLVASAVGGLVPGLVA